MTSHAFYVAKGSCLCEGGGKPVVKMIVTVGATEYHSKPTSLYLCADCWELEQEQRRDMRGSITRGRSIMGQVR